MTGRKCLEKVNGFHSFNLTVLDSLKGILLSNRSACFLLYLTGQKLSLPPSLMVLTVPCMFIAPKEIQIYTNILYTKIANTKYT